MLLFCTLYASFSVCITLSSEEHTIFVKARNYTELGLAADLSLGGWVGFGGGVARPQPRLAPLKLDDGKSNILNTLAVRPPTHTWPACSMHFDNKLCSNEKVHQMHDIRRAHTHTRTPLATMSF